MTDNRPSTGGALVPRPVPVPKAAKERGKRPVGERLEKVRKRVGYSLAGASQELGIDERVLDAYEAGLRTPPDELLARMAVFYEVDLDRLLGDNNEATLDDSALWLGWAEVKFEPTDDNSLRLRRLSQTIRAMRSIAEEAPIVVRTEEIGVIAPLLDLDDPNFSEDLRRWFALDDKGIEELSALLYYEQQRIKELPHNAEQS